MPLSQIWLSAFGKTSKYLLEKEIRARFSKQHCHVCFDLVIFLHQDLFLLY